MSLDGCCATQTHSDFFVMLVTAQILLSMYSRGSKKNIEIRK